MLWIYRFLLGFVTVSFSGELPERMINVCTYENLSLWGIRYRKGEIRGNLSIGDFKKLRRIRNGKRVRVHILKKVGLPFFGKKIRGRIGFFAGFILFLLILHLLSCFIWNIEIVGNEKVSSNSILSICEEIGLSAGMPKKDLVPKNKRDELLLKCDALAWCSLNLEGSRLVIDVTEVTEKTHSASPSNLIASCDGIIRKIDVQVGNCIVKVGDTVRKGDLLVSGINESGLQTSFQHSVGQIIADTERQVNFSVPVIAIVNQPMGKPVHRTVLHFYGLDLPLFLSNQTGKIITSANEKYLVLFGKRVPVYLTEKVYSDIKEIQIPISDEQLQETVEQRLQAIMEQENVKEYQIIEQNVIESEGNYEVSLHVKSKENIAKEEILIIQSGN